MAGFRHAVGMEKEFRASCRHLLQDSRSPASFEGELEGRRRGGFAARGYRFASTGSGFRVTRDSWQSSSSAPHPGCGTRRDCSPNMGNWAVELNVLSGKEARHVRNR